MPHIVATRGQRHKITLPDSLVDNQPFTIVVGTTRLEAVWLRQTATLILTDANGVERLIRLRGRALSRNDGEAATQIIADLNTGTRGGMQYVTAAMSPDVPGQDSRTAAGGARDQVLRSPITGKVVKVLVSAGEEVAAGQAVVIIEAMKMENRVFATAAGTVSSVSVKDGDAAQSGKELLRIAP